VIRESDLLCSFELLHLDCFFFSFFLAIISIVIKARDTTRRFTYSDLRLVAKTAFSDLRLVAKNF
jgi:hypothetical protein